jgi:hypothetical protein
MHFLRRSVRKSKLERVRNEEIRQMMQEERTALDRTEIRKLKLFVHLMRMPRDRRPVKIHTQISVGRRRGNDIGHSRMASQRQWRRGGWMQKKHKTGRFAEENWEGGRPTYKPIYIRCNMYEAMISNLRLRKPKL